LLGNAILAEVTNSLSIPKYGWQLQQPESMLRGYRLAQKHKAGLVVAQKWRQRYCNSTLNCHTIERSARCRYWPNASWGAGDNARERLTKLLGQHGYQFYNGTLIQVGVLDAREAQHLPQTATSELAKGDQQTC